MPNRLKVSFYLSCVLLFLWQSCTKPEADNPLPPVEPEPPAVISDTSATDANAVSYLALGDSYTIGTSVSESVRFPRQLADSLIYNGIDFKELRIVARNGWTTDELSRGLDAEAINAGDYNLVSLLIGVNNQFRGYPLDEYRAEFTALLDRAIAYAGGNRDRVFVVSIPDYGVTPFGQIYGSPGRIAEEIDRFNAANLEITKLRKVRYFDITPISREAENDRGLIASDGLHPSGRMYRRWVELMLPELLEELRK